MTASELVTRVRDIAQNYKTLYVMGCFGAPLTGKNVGRYLNNHAYNRKSERQKMIQTAANQTPPVYGFDCVCLIKGILWGWKGDAAKTYGGAVYTSNNVPDIDANQMIQVCSGVSTDFRGIVPGAAVWMQDHIGIYVGDGLAVECSPKWANCVQVTAVGNIGKRSGYNTRTWTKWGLLPYVTYEEEKALTETEIRSIVREELQKIETERSALPASGWAEPFIRTVVQGGAMSNDGKGSIDRPRAYVTREELAVVGANLLTR